MAWEGSDRASRLPANHEGRIVNDYWKHRPPPAIDDIEALARYNAERSRGIAHDPEWDARMAQLQEHFAARQVAALTENEISRRRRRGRWT